MTEDQDFIELTGELIGAATVDQLTRDERVRLEALALAVSLASPVDLSIGQIIGRARDFHSYITGP